MATSFSPGSDEWVDAPEIGFGQSATTPNAGFHPATWAEEDAEPQPDAGGPTAMQSAWWKFVAPGDGWVRFHTHASTTTFTNWGSEPITPETVLAVYINTPDQGHCINQSTASITLDATPVYGPSGEFRWDYVDTSETIVKVDAGWTYWVQVGMYDLYTDDDPDAVTTYVLTVDELIATPHEIVVPAVGPFYDSPDDGVTGVPSIVGGNDALRRESAGYIDFPLDTKARYGGFQAPFAGQEEWPPPAQARRPQDGWPGLQQAYRYYAKRLRDDLYFGDSIVEGNPGGVYLFHYAQTHHPTIDGIYEWNAATDAWDWTGNTGSPPVAGPNTLTEGVNQGVWLTSSEEFLADGEYRTMLLSGGKPDEAEAAAKWESFYGYFHTPPFSQTAYQIDRHVLIPGTPGEPILDEDLGAHIWFTPADGSRLDDGVEYAQEGRGLRIEWFEWIVRWIVFEVKLPAIEGGPIGDRRAFNDGHE